jgi:hypothetical protein
MAKKLHYIDNKLLEKELKVFNETFNSDVLKIKKNNPKFTEKEAKKLAQGYISEELGDMFLKIAQNLINKTNFNRYPYRDEMVGLGVEYLCRFAKSFKAHLPNSNGFSYCTQICYHGFQQVIIKEKKRAALKDSIIKEAMQKSELEKWQNKSK